MERNILIRFYDTDYIPLKLLTYSGKRQYILTKESRSSHGWGEVICGGFGWGTEGDCGEEETVLVAVSGSGPNGPEPETVHTQDERGQLQTWQTLS